MISSAHHTVFAARALRRYCLVSVMGPPGSGGVHVLLVTAGVPTSVETAPIVTAIVPPIWPAHDG